MGDSDGNGMLSAQELEEGIAKAGISGGDLKALISEMDADGSGNIDYTEFIAAALDRKVATADENCRAAFMVFDTDGDGRISLEELRELLQKMDPKTSAEAVLKEVDTNGD